VASFGHAQLRSGQRGIPVTKPSLAINKNCIWKQLINRELFKNCPAFRDGSIGAAWCWTRFVLWPQARNVHFVARIQRLRVLFHHQAEPGWAWPCRSRAPSLRHTADGSGRRLATAGAGDVSFHAAGRGKVHREINVTEPIVQIVDDDPSFLTATARLLGQAVSQCGRFRRRR
jgi:hypothetical protein